LPIPVPVAKGQPGEGFPWPWSIYRWLEGETVSLDRLPDLTGFARDLAAFLATLQRLDATGGPLPGLHSAFRGGSLEIFDPQTRLTIEALHNEIDAAAATEAWETALAAKWRHPPVWFHGDVAVANLLLRQGRLGAVIDFGCSGVGDPACDTVIAWTLFSGESRAAFKAGLDLDGATWARGRGWALWKALITLAEYRATDLAKAEDARRVLKAVLDEHKEEPKNNPGW
jgi:aminoglycoside phosphotransferase (APT) family kinase protein